MQPDESRYILALSSGTGDTRRSRDWLVIREDEEEGDDEVTLRDGEEFEAREEMQMEGGNGKGRIGVEDGDGVK